MSVCRPGSAEAVLGHVDRHLAADDIAPGTQPGALFELQAETDRLRQRAVNGRGQVDRLEHDHAHVRPPGMSGQTAQGRFVAGTQPFRKIDHEQVNLMTGDERRGQRPALVDVLRPADEQPAQIDAARLGLQRIEDPSTGPGTRRSRHVPVPGQGSAARARSCHSSARL